MQTANRAKSKFITLTARLFRRCHVWICDNIIKRRAFAEITARETQGKDITHRERRCAREIKTVKFSVLRAYITALLIARQNRVEINSAARGITAIERALRPLKHFSLTDIKEQRARLHIRCLIGSVHINSGGRRC